MERLSTLAAEIEANTLALVEYRRDTNDVLRKIVSDLYEGYGSGARFQASLSTTVETTDRMVKVAHKLVKEAEDILASLAASELSEIDRNEWLIRLETSREVSRNLLAVADEFKARI